MIFKGAQRVWALLALIIVCALCFGIQAQARADGAPVVIELFTSKGCPACPPADAHFKELVDRPDILALSCHVSYFNSRSFGDKLSRPLCDARQGLYKDALNTGGIFTPMMVLNGRDYITGQKRSDIMQALEKNKNRQAYPPLAIQRQEGYLDIRLPHIALDRPVDVWLVTYMPRTVTSGYEHYRNIFVDMTKLMNWNGGPVNFVFPVQGPSSWAYAVIVQDSRAGIITAGLTEGAGR